METSGRITRMHTHTKCIFAEGKYLDLAGEPVHMKRSNGQYG